LEVLVLACQQAQLTGSQCSLFGNPLLNKGGPLDTQEGAWGNVIRSGLAVRAVKNPGAIQDDVFVIPPDLKKIVGRMEIRVLGFELAE